MQRLFSLTLGLALVASVAGAPYTMLVCDEVSYGRRPRLPDQLARRPIPHKCCTVACTVASVDQLTHACIPLSLLISVLSDPSRTLTTLPLCPLLLLDSPPSALPPPSFPLSRPSTLSTVIRPQPPPTASHTLHHTGQQLLRLLHEQEDEQARLARHRVLQVLRPGQDRLRRSQHQVQEPQVRTKRRRTGGDDCRGARSGWGCCLELLGLLLRVAGVPKTGREDGSGRGMWLGVAAGGSG